MTKKNFLRKKTFEKTKNKVEQVYDPFRDFQGTKVELYLAKFFYYIRKNSKIFIILSSSLIVILLAVITYVMYHQNLESKALIAFEELQKSPIFKAGTNDPKILISRLDQYMNDYNIKSAKKRAIIKKIEIYEQNNLEEEVAKQYEELAKIVEVPEIKANLYFRSAILFENQEVYTRALSNIDEVLKQKINDEYILANTLFLQARILFKIGKKAEAKKVAENILNLKSEKYNDLGVIQNKVLVYFLSQE